MFESLNFYKITFVLLISVIQGQVMLATIRMDHQIWIHSTGPNASLCQKYGWINAIAGERILFHDPKLDQTLLGDSFVTKINPYFKNYLSTTSNPWEINKSISFIITSPNYPRNYPNDIECIAVVTAPENYYLTFELAGNLEIEPSPKCKFDFLEILRGQWSWGSPLLKKFCGIHSLPKLPASIGSHVKEETVEKYVKSVWIRFRSDHELNYSGFRMVVRLVPIETKDFWDSEARRGHFFTQKILSRCSKIVGANGGDITSLQIRVKDIPRDIRVISQLLHQSIDCVWTFPLSINGNAILRFPLMAMFSSLDCKSGFLEVYEANKPILKICRATGEIDSNFFVHVSGYWQTKFLNLSREWSFYETFGIFNDTTDKILHYKPLGKFLNFTEPRPASNPKLLHIRLFAYSLNVLSHSISAFLTYHIIPLSNQSTAEVAQIGEEFENLSLFELTNYNKPDIYSERKFNCNDSYFDIWVDSKQVCDNIYNCPNARDEYACLLNSKEISQKFQGKRLTDWFANSYNIYITSLVLFSVLLTVVLTYVATKYTLNKNHPNDILLGDFERYRNESNTFMDTISNSPYSERQAFLTDFTKNEISKVYTHNNLNIMSKPITLNVKQVIIPILGNQVCSHRCQQPKIKSEIDASFARSKSVDNIRI